MELITFILVIFFTIVNFVIYHKIFNVYYFNLSKGCLTEILGCFFIALFEAGFVIFIGKFIILAVIIIAAIAYAIKRIKKDK